MNMAKDDAIINLDPSFEELCEIRENYLNFIERSNDGILIIQNGRIKFANFRLSEMMAVPLEKIRGTEFINLFYFEERSRVADLYNRRMTGQDVMPVYETILVRNDGTKLCVQLNAGLISFYGKPADLVIVRDITERKQAEEALKESEKKYRELVENANSIILRRDIHGNISFFNEFAEEFFGYAEEEILGRNVVGSIVPKLDSTGRDLSLMIEDIGRFPQKYSNNINENIRRNGERVWIAWTNRPILDENGSVVEILCIGNDITARKLAEDELKATLEEKEVLLNEIHHRVKNNLQIISSLLSLQSEDIVDANAKKAFKESQGRIKSMALVHDMLYKSENLAQINLRDYITNLTNYLNKSYGFEKRVKIKLDLEDLTLGIDKAIPFGLIINELFTNCVKYAFSKGEGGEFFISLCSKTEKAELILRDNGIGLQKDFCIQSFKSSGSLGLSLVCNLVKQIQGDIQINSNGGTEFKISFSI